MSNEGHSLPKFVSPHAREQDLTVRFAVVIILRLFWGVSTYYQRELLERMAIQGRSPLVLLHESLHCLSYHCAFESVRFRCLGTLAGK
jgi:hypothetical protein